MIYDLGDEQYRLTRPISIVIEEYEDNFAARFPPVQAYGEGQTEADAIAELKNAILDLYDESMSFETSQLGGHLSEWKQTFNILIEKTDEVAQL